LRRLFRLEPEYSKAYHNLGLALENGGKLEDAVFHYEKALQLNPDLAQAYIYLNEREYKTSTGDLFEVLADGSAIITYARKLWDFFRGLFEISFSNIFELFQIEDDFQSYCSVIDQALCESAAFRGCET
jgi:tetratricopeptide (TPR) repeat protein